MAISESEAATLRVLMAAELGRIHSGRGRSVEETELAEAWDAIDRERSAAVSAEIDAWMFGEAR